MKKLICSLALLSLVGFGCAGAPANDASVTEASTDTRYVNAQYRFSLDHSKDVDVRDREEQNRATKYLGLDVDFFASVRDMVRDDKPTNLAFLYAVPGLTVDAFQKTLEGSDATGAVKVKSVEDVTMGGVAMKKVTSTTQLGTDKIHYLWDDNGATIVVSVFIGESTEFDPILATLKTL